MIVTFFGHRNFRERSGQKEQLLKVLEGLNCENLEFLCGYNGLFDGFALRCCNEFKSRHSGAKTVLMLPYQDETYLKNNSELFSLFDETEYPLERNVPQRLAILERNKIMVQRADVVIVFVEHSWGGAAAMLHYAEKLKKKVENLAVVAI